MSFVNTPLNSQIPSQSSVTGKLAIACKTHHPFSLQNPTNTDNALLVHLMAPMPSNMCLEPEDTPVISPHQNVLTGATPDKFTTNGCSMAPLIDLQNGGPGQHLHANHCPFFEFDASRGISHLNSYVLGQNLWSSGYLDARPSKIRNRPSTSTASR